MFAEPILYHLKHLLRADVTLQPGGRTPFGNPLQQPVRKQASPHPPHDNRQRGGVPGRHHSDALNLGTVASSPQRISSVGSVTGPRHATPRAADSESCNVPPKVIEEVKEIQERETEELLQVFEEHNVFVGTHSGGCGDAGNARDRDSDVSGCDTKDSTDVHHSSKGRTHHSSNSTESGECGPGDGHGDQGNSGAIADDNRGSGSSGRRVSSPAAHGGKLDSSHHSGHFSEHRSYRNTVHTIFSHSRQSSQHDSKHEGRNKGSNPEDNASKGDSKLGSSRQHCSPSLERNMCEQTDTSDVLDIAAQEALQVLPPPRMHCRVPITVGGLHPI